MHKKFRGFTLLELLVTSVILAILSVVVAQIFFLLMRSNTKTEAMKEVKQSGDHATEVLARMIQNARDITIDCNDESDAIKFATTSMELVGQDGKTTVIRCEFDGFRARIASVSGQSIFLTGDNVTLSDIATSSGDIEFIQSIVPVGSTESANRCDEYGLQFVCSSWGGTPSTIQIFFTLQKALHSTIFEESLVRFFSTVTRRN